MHSHMQKADPYLRWRTPYGSSTAFLNSPDAGKFARLYHAPAFALQKVNLLALRFKSQCLVSHPEKWGRLRSTSMSMLWPVHPQFRFREGWGASHSLLLYRLQCLPSVARFIFNWMRPFCPTCKKQDESLQKVSRGVAEVRSQIASERLDQAESTLTMLTAEFSGVSVLYDLMGNVYYLRKDLNNALIQYRRSYELNSNNAETARMIKKIESLPRGRHMDLLLYPLGLAIAVGSIIASPTILISPLRAILMWSLR